MVKENDTLDLGRHTPAFLSDTHGPLAGGHDDL